MRGKWTTLKNRFVKELEKESASQLLSKPHTSRCHLFGNLEFLRKTLEAVETEGNFADIVNKVINSEGSTDEAVEAVIEQEDFLKGKETSSQSTTVESVESVIEKDLLEEKQISKQRKMSENKKKCDDSHKDEIVTVDLSTTESNENSDKLPSSTDPLMLYFLSLHGTISPLPPKLQFDLKTEMMTTVQTYLEKHRKG